MLLAAVGDVFVDRTDPDNALSGIQPILDKADLVFGNYEGVLTDSCSVVPGASFASLASTRNAGGLGGFDVMSLANNHAMDAGAAGLLETQGILTGLGIATTGAGETLAASLSPAVVERDGLGIAFLALTSVLAAGAEAGTGAAGVAPLRADDMYLPPYNGISCPGVAPRVVSVLNENDWARTAGAIGAAKRECDLVVVSVHWGDHTRPWVLTGHERHCAELIIEAGADLILGHHQHMMRGIEFIGGKPVLFGLGHIVFDYPRYPDVLRSRGLDISALSDEQLAGMFGEYGIYPRRAHPAFPFPPLARRTGVALLRLEKDGVRAAGIVPCVIDDDGIARPVSRQEPEWPRVREFFERCQSSAGLAGRVNDAGAEYHGHALLEFGQSEM